MSKVVNASKHDFKEVTNEGVVLLDFWAAWCGPCKMLSPVLDELSEDLDGKATVVKVNVDEEPEIASEYSVMGIPALFVLKDGKVVDKANGFMPKELLSSLVGKYV